MNSDRPRDGDLPTLTPWLILYLCVKLTPSQPPTLPKSFCWMVCGLVVGDGFESDFSALLWAEPEALVYA